MAWWDGAGRRVAHRRLGSKAEDAGWASVPERLRPLGVGCREERGGGAGEQKMSGPGTAQVGRWWVVGARLRGQAAPNPRLEPTGLSGGVGEVVGAVIEVVGECLGREPPGGSAASR